MIIDDNLINWNHCSQSVIMGPQNVNEPCAMRGKKENLI